MRRTLFTTDHEQFRSSVRAVLARHLAPHVETHRRAGLIGRDVWKVLGDQGFLGFMVPDEYGGGGVDDFRYNVVLAEELVPYGLAYASSIGMNVDVIAPYLLELTTAEQRERWLPRFCSGDLITAVGMTEPTTGSDLAAIRTTANPSGNGWTLNGAKTFITNGTQADLVVTAAQTRPGSGRHGITLFAVESGADGFSRGRKLEKLGQPEADTAELFFDGVQLTRANLLGQVGEGFGYMMARLPNERLGCAVSSIAHARWALERTLDYVKYREAFGQRIGSFQHNKFLLASLATEIDITQCFVDRCVEEHLAGSLSGQDAAMAKYWSTDLQGRTLDSCVQLHGGYGYMQECDVARAWSDARVTRIWAGTNEIMREVIGRSLGL